MYVVISDIGVIALFERFLLSCSIYSPDHSTDFSNRLCLYVPQTDGITIILSHQVTSGVENSCDTRLILTLPTWYVIAVLYDASIDPCRIHYEM